MRGRDQKGFSLIELLIAMVLTLILLANGFQLLVVQHRQYIIQEGIAEAQQNLRAGMDMMAREIRLAGYGVPANLQKIVMMESEAIGFLANLNGVATHLTASASSGQNVLSVSAGQDFQAGKRVYLCDGTSCERHTLAEDGVSHSLFLKEPLSRGRPFEIGSRVDVVNQVRYYLGSGDPKSRKLMREVDQGAVSLAEQVVGVAFDYLDRNGNVASVPSDVRRVQIRLVTAASGPSSTSPPDQNDRERALSTQVRLRNF